PGWRFSPSGRPRDADGRGASRPGNGAEAWFAPGDDGRRAQSAPRQACAVHPAHARRWRRRTAGVSAREGVAEERGRVGTDRQRVASRHYAAVYRVVREGGAQLGSIYAEAHL